MIKKNFLSRYVGDKQFYRTVLAVAVPMIVQNGITNLVNLLDNAREECCRLQEKGEEQVRVRLEIHPHQSYLLICCSNTTDRTALQRKGSGLLSTKGEAKYHGYGTRIITKMAEKYNGCADFKLENGMFLAQVMLDMTGGSHE